MCCSVYTATQYALLASIGTAGRTTLASSSGALVDWLNGDWGTFFIITTVMVIPSLICLWFIKNKINYKRIPYKYYISPCLMYLLSKPFIFLSKTRNTNLRIINYLNKLLQKNDIADYSIEIPLEFLNEAKKIIKNNPSINFVYLHREYDKEAWKYSKKGFFNFKKHIPELITKINNERNFKN